MEIKSSIEAVRLDEFMRREFQAEGPVIDPILRKKEMIILSATAKTGKSMFISNIAIAVAQGKLVLNRFETQAMRVLIWQTEVSDANLQARLKRMMGVEDGEFMQNIFIVGDRIKLDTPTGLSFLKEALSRVKPDLVILDPLYTLHNSDENVAAQMAPLLSDVRDVIRAAEAACIMVHHQGKPFENSRNRQTGFQHRGSSAFADVPDGSWSIVRIGSTSRAKLSFELRNAQSPEPIEIELNETGWWQVAEAQPQTTRASITAEATAELVEGELRKSEFVKVLVEQFGISERTAESKIADAVKKQLLNRTTRGKVAFYSKP